MAIIQAPFTETQLKSLKEHQANDMLHPYTSTSGTVLIPTKDGWVEYEGGPVVQNWAHEL